MKYDKSLTTKIINEMVMKEELLRLEINVASRYLMDGNQSQAEMHLEKFYLMANEIVLELQDFFELVKFIEEQKKIKF